MTLTLFHGIAHTPPDLLRSAQNLSVLGHRERNATALCIVLPGASATSPGALPLARPSPPACLQIKRPLTQEIVQKMCLAVTPSWPPSLMRRVQARQTLCLRPLSQPAWAPRSSARVTVLTPLTDRVSQRESVKLRSAGLRSAGFRGVRRDYRGWPGRSSRFA